MLVIDNHLLREDREEGLFLRLDRLALRNEREIKLDLSSVSLPRERFWDVQVPKIDSPTRQSLMPRPPCVRAATPHHRRLGAGSAALPQMAQRRVGCACMRPSPATGAAPPSPLRPHARAYAYRGLPALASLSMAGSEGRYFPVPREILTDQDFLNPLPATQTPEQQFDASDSAARPRQLRAFATQLFIIHIIA